ncbi:MAG TPA: hypothetical protein VHD35_01080 [Chitinophagaceae bacterium]|nr:hypothetical protein [Chitinophagaceae bacterium]
MRFYRKLFEIFYRWGYNNKLPEQINHPENAAVPTIAALTCFNIFSLVLLFKIFILRRQYLVSINYQALFGIILYILLYIIYHFSFVSDGKCKNIKLDKEKNVKAKENILLSVYIIASIGLNIILALYEHSLHLN